MRSLVLGVLLASLAACGGGTADTTGKELPGLGTADGIGGEVTAQDVNYATDDRKDAPGPDAAADAPGIDPLSDPVQPDVAEAGVPTDTLVATDEGLATAETGTPDSSPLDLGSETSAGGCDPCGVGDVAGKTCAPNAKMAVPYVQVWVETVDCSGNPVHIQTYSNAKGEYTLKNVPCGQQTIYMQKGSFQHQWNRFVDQGMVTVLSSGEGCFPGTAAKIAVITGDWDAIQNTLKLLSLKYTLFNGVAPGGPMGGDNFSQEAINFLTDTAKLNSYDVLFINCSDSGVHNMGTYEGPAIQAALKAFVAKGGSIYASDYGLPYLTGTWPGYILGGSWSAGGNGSYQTTVVDTDLAGYLAKTQVTIKYGLGPLTCVTGIGSGTDLFLDSTTAIDGCSGTQMMMSFQPEGPSGGKVIYTTFHNDEQPTAGGDMESILEYTVFLM